MRQVCTVERPYIIIYGYVRPVLCQDRTTKRIDLTKKACRIPAHERPRSQSPTPENRLPTVNFFIVQAPVAVVRLGAGAHGPHGVDGSASGAFDAQIKGRPSSKHLVAMPAPDLVVVCSLHFLIVLPLRPRIRPDMRLRARGLTVSHKRRRKPCTML